MTIREALKFVNDLLFSIFLSIWYVKTKTIKLMHILTFMSYRLFIMKLKKFRHNFIWENIQLLNLNLQKMVIPTSHCCNLVHTKANSQLVWKNQWIIFRSLHLLHINRIEIYLPDIIPLSGLNDTSKGENQREVRKGAR